MFRKLIIAKKVIAFFLFVSFCAFVLSLFLENVVPEFFNIALYSAIISGISFLIVSTAQNLYSKHLAQTLPEKQKQAKVIGKETFSTTTGNVSDGNGTVRTVHNFNITFEFFDGSRQVFSTNSDLYNTIFENDEGTLFYKEFPDNSLLMTRFDRR